MNEQPFEGWAVVEVMGHRKVAGFCDHIRVAGAEMLRVSPPGADETAPDGPPLVLSAASIFAVHPCDEETVRKITRPPPFAPAQLTGYDPEPDDPDDWDDDGPSEDTEDSAACVSVDVEERDRTDPDLLHVFTATAEYGIPEFVEHKIVQHGWSRDVAIGRALIGLGRELLASQGEVEETDDAGRESTDGEPEELETDSGDPEPETASEGKAEADNDDEEIPW